MTDQNTTQNTVANTPDDPSIQALMKSIGTVESSGNYNATGDGGNSLGAYQISKQNWSSWGQQYLGDANAPLTPANQDKVAYNRISDLAKEGYNAAQVASIWNSGKPDPTGNIGVNKQTGEKFDTPQYVKSVGNTYNQIMQGSSNPTVTPTDSTVGGTAPTPAPYGALNPASKDDTLAGGALKTVENIPSSAWNLAKNLGNVIMHPLATMKNIGDVISGGVEDAMDATGITKAFGGTPTDTVEKQKAGAVWNALKNRYGSLDALRNTVENDPVGFAMDVSTVLSGVGAGVSGVAGASDLADATGLTSGMNASDAASMTSEAARTGELGTASNIGQKISDVGNAINPVGLAVKGVGGAMNLVGQGAIGASKLIDWANSTELVDQPLSKIATGFALKLLGGGVPLDMIAGYFEPQIAKLIDWATLNGGKGLIGAGNAISKTAPMVGTVGQVGNYAGLLNQK
jgi:hypothetical protein